MLSKQDGRSRGSANTPAMLNAPPYNAPAPDTARHLEALSVQLPLPPSSSQAVHELSSTSGVLQLAADWRTKAWQPLPEQIQGISPRRHINEVDVNSAPGHSAPLRARLQGSPTTGDGAKPPLLEEVVERILVEVTALERPDRRTDLHEQKGISRHGPTSHSHHHRTQDLGVEPAQAHQPESGCHEIPTAGPARHRATAAGARRGAYS